MKLRVLCCLLLTWMLVASCTSTAKQYQPQTDDPHDTPEESAPAPRGIGVTFSEGYASKLVRFDNPEADDVVYFENEGLYAVWYDPSARVSRVTVHWYTEYPQGVVITDESKKDSWTLAGYPASVPSASRARSNAYLQADHTPEFGPFERGHLVENAAFQLQSLRNLTFRTYNCVPEVSAFNAPLWSGVELESRIAVNMDNEVDGEMALVFTGIVIDESTATRIPLRGSLVDQGVVVPTIVWRVVYLCGTDRTAEAVRTWVRRQTPEGEHGQFDVDGDGEPDEFTISQIEAMAGIKLP